MMLRFLPHIILLTVTLNAGSTIAQGGDFHYGCVRGENYTINSPYESNLKTILSTLASNTDRYGFYNYSTGENLGRVNVVVLCRGDVELDICRSCVNDSATKLLKICPNFKEALGGYDECMIRYRPINVSMVRPSVYVYNDKDNVSSVDEYNQVRDDLLVSLRDQAASGGTHRKFAVGDKMGPDSRHIYALVQCTPDLSKVDCTSCLNEALGEIPKCCDQRIGGRVLKVICNLQYETDYKFFTTNSTTGAPVDSPLATPGPPPPGKINTTEAPDSPPAPRPPPPGKINTTEAPDSPPAPRPPPPGKINGKTTQKTVIIIVVLAVTSVILVIVSICILRRKKKPKKSTQKFEICEDVDEISAVEFLRYDFSTISLTTDNFSEANKLGQGGFGAVYKGKLLNGQAIAVKRLSKNSGQGDVEFKNEIMILAKLQHRNLVRLLGFCLEGIEKILVYEFVNNSSLDNFIFDPIKRAQLDWNRRYKIIEGIARGLLYLHEDSLHRIIHRDLKASNILLDEHMNPKISDFGMARLFVVDETHERTRRIVGTYGYMAPEYALQGHFSVKSDVFSFGVLILEIVSGQKNNYFGSGENMEHITSHAWRSWREGTVSRMIDPTLMRDSSGSTRDMIRCIHIGLLCVQENIAVRPTMASVVLMLNSFSMSLAVPSKPAFILHNGTNPETQFPQDNNSPTMNHMSRNEASITELDPR